MTEEVLDGTELLRIFSGDETGCTTSHFHPGRSADPVNIILRTMR
jgi:hypothetical protein